MGVFIVKCFSICCLFLFSNVFAQKIEKGFGVGWGYALNERTIPEGVYRLLYVQGRVAYNLTYGKLPHKSIFEKLLVGAEPQYNRVWIDTAPKEWETGLNFFLQPTFFLNKTFQPYCVFSLGPHYFSTPTIHQRQGFIFSDSMGIGSYVSLHKKVYFHFNFRIRHLSNANTRLPNFGINTYNFHCGWVW
ncbi:acyloxyacyl hydrolase [Raineya orbicola]|uniref:Lipid A 3-O-deacylase (PagL) n=1 Tax=Raineya orbicola TaxID=2016530 RepID=A0A2N3IKF7_9BACT|nr:acyloxyacyl hydrolase [Raineya orbicola]PKQ70819.1 Lipid A 3-O-deacylase (PagL) [Raineya orbicola]